MEELDYTENNNIFDILLKIIENTAGEIDIVIYNALVDSVTKEKSKAELQYKHKKRKGVR